MTENCVKQTNYFLYKEKLNFWNIKHSNTGNFSKIVVISKRKIFLKMFVLNICQKSAKLLSEFNYSKKFAGVNHNKFKDYVKSGVFSLESEYLIQKGWKHL